MTVENTIVYLIGMPGVGKYTIAKELTAQAGFRLIDNHLINNPIFNVVKLDPMQPVPDRVWHYVGKILQSVLDAVTEMSPAEMSFILTNHLAANDPADKALFEKMAGFATARKSTFIPVRLIISDREQHKKRLMTPSRGDRHKLTDPDALPRFEDVGLLETDHQNTLTLDVTALSPEDAARDILAHIAKIQRT